MWDDEHNELIIKELEEEVSVPPMPDHREGGSEALQLMEEVEDIDLSDISIAGEEGFSLELDLEEDEEDAGDDDDLSTEIDDDDLSLDDDSLDMRDLGIEEDDTSLPGDDDDIL